MLKTKNRFIVLVAGMIIQLCAGILYMWSVFKVPVEKHLNWSSEASTLTSSIMLAMFVAGIVIGGRTQDKIGPRKVVIIGSILMSLGMLTTSFVSPDMPWFVYITYGVIGGLGVGFLYTTTVSVVQKWFPDKRGFATGMMVSAFGFSLVLFAPLTTKFLNDLGVPSTFLILGILFLVVCVLCALLINNPQTTSQTANQKQDVKQYSTAEMLRTKQFYLIAASMFFLLPAYFILNPLFKQLAVERGLSDGMATLLVMITGIASASGRLLFSWLSDLIGRKGSIYSIIGVMLIAVLLLIPAHGILLLFCVGAIAFAFGGTAGVYPSLTADNFGTKNMGLNYGCVMIAFGSSALIFQALSSRLIKGGSYTPSFILAGASCVISLILVLLIKPVKK